jgi:hypothetical protein
MNMFDYGCIREFYFILFWSRKLEKSVAHIYIYKWIKDKFLAT